MRSSATIGLHPIHLIVMCGLSFAAVGVAQGQCQPPTNINVSDGDNCDGIEVTWPAVASVTGYVVWRSATLDVFAAQPVGITSETSFLDSTAELGETYFYWVQSECHPFTSTFSDPEQASSAPPPSPPQNLQATTGTECGGVKLTWTLPPAGSEYRVFRSTTTDFTFAQMVGTAVDTDSFLDTSAPVSTSVNSLWYWVQPVTACGEGNPVMVEGWRCPPDTPAHGVPISGVSNWRARAMATLFNACRVGPQDYRDFFIGDVAGVDQILQPQNYSAMPPLQWNKEVAAAANYHAVDISTVGCDPFEFHSCDGTSFVQRMLSFFTDFPPTGSFAHLPLSFEFFGDSPPSSLVEDMKNPAFLANFHLRGGTSALPDSQAPWYRDFIFDKFTFWTAKQFGVGYSTETEANGIPFVSIEVTPIWPHDPKKIVIASHTPDAEAENVLYIAIYHDPIGVGPQDAQIEINGESFTLGLLTGTSSSGAFFWSEPICSESEFCRQYRFRFVTAFGEELYYPEVGWLGAAGLPCDCEAEHFEELDPGLPGNCPADLNGDSVVNVFDMLELLSVWGPCPGCPADLNGDGVVNVFDLLELLSDWGACPE
ncbi:MAG: hypothetical protein EA377_08035 [Phycisphaerales bacterium]|nr:MAG: hypothetical protein EA377_08035 [Phycisphaerales bacterium]